jgi:hypothetical protein
MEFSLPKKYVIMVTNLDVQPIANLILAIIAQTNSELLLFAKKYVEMASEQPTKSVIMEES